MNIRKILLATDLSEESERPYAWLADLARSTGAKITLLNVVEDLVVPAHGAPLAPPLHPIDNAERIKHAREELKEHAAKLGAGVDVSCAVIEGSPVSNTIADYAAKEGFDLLTIASHGRGGFKRMLLGSVAETLLRHATIPVIVFPRGD